MKQTSGLPSCKFVSCTHPPPAPPPPPLPKANFKGCFKDKTMLPNGTHECDLTHPISGGCGTKTGHQQWGRTLERCNAACQAYKYDPDFEPWLLFSCACPPVR